MSKLPKSMQLDEVGIGRLSVKEDTKSWLVRLLRRLDLIYRAMRDQIELGGSSTEDWEIRQSNAADVTAGDSVAVGNLIVRHKTNGTKFEFEA
ncbi:MAG: hypothetical protein V3U75_04050 [Methylococcaceae bacterium]